MRHFSFIILVSMSLMVVSCAPEREARQYSHKQVDFGPQKSDVDLGLDGLKTSANSQIQIKGDLRTSDFLKFIEELHVYGESTGKDTFVQASRKMLTDFENAKGVIGKIPVSESPYFQAAVGETEDQALKEIGETQEILERDKGRVLQAIPQVELNTDLRNSDLVDIGVQFLNKFEHNIQILDMDERIRQALIKELQTYRSKIENTLHPMMSQYLRSQDAGEKLRLIQEAAQQLDVKLNQSDSQIIQSLLVINDKLSKVKDEQDVLDVIVSIWEILTPSDRENVFAQKSKDLFDFLTKRSEKQLRCLKNEDCNSFYIGLAKSFRILPQIKKMGVFNLQKDIQSALVTKIDEKLLLTAVDLMQTMPKLVENKIVKGIDEKQAELAKLSSQYPQNIEAMLREWAKREVGTDSVNAFENDVIIVEKIGSRPLMIKENVKENKDLIEIETVGQSFSTNAQVLESMKLETQNKKQVSKRILHQINRMLALSGYRNSSGEDVPAFAVSVETKNSGKDNFSIKRFLQSKSVFVYPDQVYTDGIRSIEYGNILPSVSVRSQALLLQGLSSMVRYLQDWRKNSFDQAFHDVTTEKYMKGSIGAEINKPLFPKDSLLSLAVANSSVILTNIMKDLTPVFLLSSQSHLIWANEFDFSTGGAATMAGVVNIKGLQREKRVYAQDISDYILALSAFLDATKDIARTQAPLLQRKDEKGESPVQTLIQSREKIKLLIIGLANFLSHQMIHDDGLVVNEYRVDLAQQVNQERFLATQYKAIQALLQASRQSHVHIYKNVAIDIYYSMNTILFNRQVGAYASSESKVDLRGGVVNLREAVSILKTLQELEGVVPEKSRYQLQLLEKNYESMILKVI
ncbi:MAG: hypothetical protein BroJett040_11900 [Oligoflexia bacterium]|nr:MAG: hypothetical protein BroJett040_11900 [Oligoflexia bacterium]